MSNLGVPGFDPYKNFSREQVEAFEGRIVIVTGGRDYRDEYMVGEVLDFLRPDLLVEGGCPDGADALVREWLKEAHEAGATILHDRIDAPWRSFPAGKGNPAGPVRNQAMIDKYASKANVVVVAFKGGRGTADCVKKAIGKNMIVLGVL